MRLYMVRYSLVLEMILANNYLTSVLDTFF